MIEIRRMTLLDEFTDVICSFSGFHHDEKFANKIFSWVCLSFWGTCPLCPSNPEDPSIVSETDAVNKLACGLTNTYLPDLVKSKKLLNEVVDSQRVIIETLQQENAKFQDCSAVSEVTYTMDRARIYHAKLINIKREMLNLHEKAVQLKKRALKLQQQKQKEALQAEQQREREMEKERKLAARDVSNKKT